eukprot:1157711-Pelagomonas_calceolata.AAC.17
MDRPHSPSPPPPSTPSAAGAPHRRTPPSLLLQQHHQQCGQPLRSPDLSSGGERVFEEGAGRRLQPRGPDLHAWVNARGVGVDVHARVQAWMLIFIGARLAHRLAVWVFSSAFFDRAACMLQQCLLALALAPL